MTACFQKKKEDVTGEYSCILKKDDIYREFFLTAPCGMVKVYRSGKKFVYAERKKIKNISMIS